jgi:hypothetical protein
MSPRETDAALRRLERRSLVACLVLAALALVVRRGRPDVAAGIVGGGALAGMSYWGIKMAVDRLTAAIRPGADGIGRGRRQSVALGLTFFVFRYALLGFVAYVMIARLRLHPVGLVVGATSVVAAAAVEAIRITRT